MLGLNQTVPRDGFMIADDSRDSLDSELKCIHHMTDQKKKKRSSAFMELLKKARLIQHHREVDGV